MPSCAWSGLGGPMPRSIALVLRGRCRPSPDRVPEGASPDRNADGIVTGHLSFLRGEGLLPVLIAPHRCVRRVHGNDRQAVFGRHGHEPGLELAGGDAGDELPEALTSAVLLAGLLGGEVQVLQADGFDAAPVGPVQQLADGVPDLGVTVVCAAGQVVEEPLGVADRVAVPVEPVGGEVVGVGVHADHALRARRLKRDRLDNGPCPRRCQVPAAPLHVQVDTVGHSPVVFDPVAPLGSPVLELHAGSEDGPAVLAVGQVGERGGQFDTDLAIRRDADGLVAEAFAGLAVGGEEPPFGFPPLTPLLDGELGGLEVVTVVEEADGSN